MSDPVKRDAPQPKKPTASWRRELSLTSSGKYLVLITIAVGIGASNTGNSLLFLLLGMMLALIIASGILSEQVLRNVRVQRVIPRRAVAQRPAAGGYILHNDKDFASLSIEVADRRALALSGPLAGEMVGPMHIPWWKFWRKTNETNPIASTYLLRVDNHSEREVQSRFELPERGRYQFDRVSIVTRFPFGLFEKTRNLDQESELVVFPAPLPAEDWFSEVRSRWGDIDANRRGSGEEFFGLREYRPGEDRRRIHWKTSARRNTLLVKETEQQVQRSVEVVFCNWPAEVPTPLFEHGLRKTAGLIEVLAETGYEVGLVTSQMAIPAGSGRAHQDRILHALALADPTDVVPTVEPAGSGRIVVGTPAAAASVGDYDVLLDLAGLPAVVEEIAE